MNDEYKAALSVFKKSKEMEIAGFKISNLKAGNYDTYIINSGEGKARAGIATAFGIEAVLPEFIIDTGSCGAIDDTVAAGTIIIATSCHEYDISGYGIPEKKLKRMLISTGFDKFGENRIIKEGANVSCGDQACGEIIVNSDDKKARIRRLFNVCACNFETAGVFICALKRNIPCLSIRIITDKADENVHKDFKENFDSAIEKLYTYINVCIEKEWFSYIKDFWDKKKIIVY